VACPHRDEMKCFGFDSQTLQRVPTPVGEECAYCSEPIREDDQGVTVNAMGFDRDVFPYHRVCFLGMIGDGRGQPDA
jgi:hypothetical protein